MKGARVSQAELGRRVAKPKRDINRLCLGQVRFIDPWLAKAIERETGGAVTALDLIDFVSENQGGRP